MMERTARLFRHLFRREEDARTRAIVATLREVGLFRNFSRSALRDLAEAVHQRDYRRDEFMYYERDPGLGLYVVQRGRVRLLVEDEAGAVHELRQVSEHDVFGKLSLLGDFRRMETAQAVTDTRLLGLFRPDLRTIIKRHPATGAAFVEAMARNLAASQIELLHLVAGKEGKVGARRLLEGVSTRVDASGPDAPVPSET
jgi:CRP/FNR family cyclic AMP-dependent transcriptional regulator